MQRARYPGGYNVYKNMTLEYVIGKKLCTEMQILCLESPVLKVTCYTVQKPRKNTTLASHWQSKFPAIPAPVEGSRGIAFIGGEHINRVFTRRSSSFISQQFLRKWISINWDRLFYSCDFFFIDYAVADSCSAVRLKTDTF